MTWALKDSSKHKPSKSNWYIGWGKDSCQHPCFSFIAQSHSGKKLPSQELAFPLHYDQKWEQKWCVCLQSKAVKKWYAFSVLFPPGYWLEAMAPRCSTLAWKIPWMDEPGGLQSMRSLRVRYDWANSLSLFTFMYWRRKWQPAPVFLPGESQGWGSLVGCHLWGHTESDVTEVT